jgi:hypothetical protein
MLVTIGFESEEAQLRKLPDRLRLMSDKELVLKCKLQERREEWRRRYPKV